jgi:hypothetical protein
MRVELAKKLFGRYAATRHQTQHNACGLSLANSALQIDFRLVPVMAILYLLAHIDRGNIGNAKIEGMDRDLGLVGNQYNIASTIFFVPYIIFGLPL